jgi:RNA polymerase sigma factor (sigma-70 family)
MAGQALSIPRSLGALFDIGVVGDLSDGQLLERFTTGHREAAELAFHALVERHGPMVLQMCRRLLDDPNDAEDAFQATFLVLLRRAGEIRDRGSVSAWLHGVALRVASRARVESARRRRIERHGGRPATGRNDDPDRLDLEALIDVELARLPEKYRAPIVLCYLEGLTHEGAAARLGWPVGTVRGRLSRARDLLRSRLTRRGVTATVALATVEGLCDSAKSAVPAALREATVRAAVEVALGSAVATVVSVRVAERVTEACRSLVSDRLKTAASVLLLLGTVGAGLAMLGAVSPPRDQRPTPTDSRETIRREMLQLKGTWSTTGTEQEFIADVPQPPKTVKMIWSIDRDTITQTDGEGFAGWTFRYTLDPGKSPKTIDLTSLNTGLSLQGIYKLDGDTLTIRYGHERPGRFATPPSDLQFVFQRDSRIPTRLSPEYPNADGCYWAIRPMGGGRRGAGFPSSMTSGGISLILRKAPDGAMLLVLASIGRFADGEPVAEYRPVALDGDKKRYLFEPHDGGWSTSATVRDVVLAQQEFRLDPAMLPFERVNAMGIEVVPAEVRRAAKQAASAQAIEEARRAGIEIATRPEIGKPLEFSFKDTKGRVIRSAELRGKVVLIDCWASWSGPCTEKLPRLKALYDRRRNAGFEVIGLNFDDDPGRAERLVRALALPWPQVFVPGDCTRRLWNEDSALPNFPRSLLIDRQGILRWDGGPGELEARIESLLK